MALQPSSGNFETDPIPILAAATRIEAFYDAAEEHPDNPSVKLCLERGLAHIMTIDKRSPPDIQIYYVDLHNETNGLSAASIA